MSVPLYAFIIYISLLAPWAYNGLEIPIAIIEGYAIYCFFALIVTNLGGPNESVKYMNGLSKPLCCTLCCPVEKYSFYMRTLWSCRHILVTRVVLVILAAIFENIKAVYIVLSIVSFALIARAVLSVVTFFEHSYERSANFMGVSKLFILKVSVGLIVFQGLIVQIVIGLNKVTLASDSTYNSDERAIRLYCFIVLLEYLIISTAMYVSFSSEITASPYIQSTDSSSPTLNTSNYPFSSFIKDLFRVFDIFGRNTLPDVNDLNSNLVPVVAKAV